MAVQTTTNLSNSIRTLYAADYLEGAKPMRLYDQFFQPVSELGMEKAARLGTTLQVPFASVLPITTAAIPQTVDIIPRVLRDAVASITTTSRGDALQWAERVDVDTYTNIAAERYRAVGSQAMRSIDWEAMRVALTGTLLYSAVARASLDAGTAAHRLNDTALTLAATRLQRMGCPQFQSGYAPYWTALMPPEAYNDLRAQGNIVNVGVYAGNHDEIILNWELGRVGPFKIVMAPGAKVFGAAGAANASAVNTTLAAPLTPFTSNQALALTIEVAAATNMVAGQLLWIGVTETANTFDETMEPVTVASIASTTITIVGSGPNGGLLFDHAVGVNVRNADSVYPIVFGSPTSGAKAYDNETGEFGEVLDPDISGNLKQFWTLGWKAYFGYGLFRQNCILRGEFSSSTDA